MDNGTLDAGTMAHWHTGTLDNAQWDVVPMEPWVLVQWITGHCGHEAMGHWDNSQHGNGPWDDERMGQWGRGAIDSWTMDVGTQETRTMGPWDNENGTVGHWRIAYWALGQCASGAMGREGHGRRDNAQ